jgi:hypothetical protein
MSIRYVLGLISAMVLGVILSMVVSGSRVAHGAGSGSLVVLCSSCSYRGLPQQGHLVLMDTNTGDVWLYSDSAMSGTAKPIYWGRLVLGQPIVRSGQGH